MPKQGSNAATGGTTVEEGRYLLKTLMGATNNALDLFENGDIREDVSDRPHLVEQIHKVTQDLHLLKGMIAEEQVEDQISNGD